MLPARPKVEQVTLSEDRPVPPHSTGDHHRSPFAQWASSSRTRREITSMGAHLEKPGVRMPWSFTSCVVHVASMSNRDDHHEQDIVVNQVQDAVDADADAEALPAPELPGRRRPRIACQQSDRTADSRTNLRVDTRSAWTFSQGMFSPGSARAASNAAMSSSSSSAVIIRSYCSGLTRTASTLPRRSRNTASVCAVERRCGNCARASVTRIVAMVKCTFRRAKRTGCSRRGFETRPRSGRSSTRGSGQRRARAAASSSADSSRPITP